MTMKRDKLLGRQFERQLSFSRESIDEESRTVDFSFSSEEPVDRFFGQEILDHSPESVRLGRLADGGPVLLGHDPDRQIGVVERVTIANGKGRVQARFSRSQLGQEVFRDIVDGIRKNISVGYRVFDMVPDEDKRDGPKKFRVTDWEPFEVSVVSVPADVNVGVGRSASEEKPMSYENDETVDVTEEPQVREASAESVLPDIDIEGIEDEATKRERGRVNEISAIAEKFKKSKKVQAEARKYITTGKSWQDFSKRAIELLAQDNQALPTDLGMTDKEVQRYSLLRLMRAQVEAKERGISPEKVAPYEYAIHLELMDKLPAKRADEVQGMLVPYDVQSRGLWAPSYRAPPADTTENVSLVATDHLADRFIEAVRATSAVMAAGATSLTGLVGDVSIPREDAIPFEWLTEDEAATDVDYVTDAVTMSPTTTAGHASMTRRLLKQSSPDVDQLIRNNLVRGAAVEIDKQALQGSGVSPLPTGVRNASGVLTKAISTGALTWAEAVGFEEAVEVATNLHQGGAYIMHPTMKRIAKTTSKDTGSGMFIWENNTVNGYPAFSSTHAGATADGIVFGNFANLLIGFWGVLDILMDPYTEAARGRLVVRAFQDVDVAVRRGNAFCIESI